VTRADFFGWVYACAFGRSGSPEALHQAWTCCRPVGQSDIPVHRRNEHTSEPHPLLVPRGWPMLDAQVGGYNLPLLCLCHLRQLAFCHSLESLAVCL